MAEKRDHVLNEPVDFVETGKDAERGPFGLSADVGDLVAQDAEQFFVMAKFIGNQHHFRGDGVEPARGDRIGRLTLGRGGDCRRLEL